MTLIKDNDMGRLAPHVVSTTEELHEIVSIIQGIGAFAFDLETRGVLDRHPDLLEHIEKE